MPHLAANFRCTRGTCDRRCRFAINVPSAGKRDRLAVQQLTLRFAVRFPMAFALWLCARACFCRDGSVLAMMVLRYAPG